MSRPYPYGAVLRITDEMVRTYKLLHPQADRRAMVIRDDGDVIRCLTIVHGDRNLEMFFATPEWWEPVDEA